MGVDLTLAVYMPALVTVNESKWKRYDVYVFSLQYTFSSSASSYVILFACLTNSIASTFADVPNLSVITLSLFTLSNYPYVYITYTECQSNLRNVDVLITVCYKWDNSNI